MRTEMIVERTATGYSAYAAKYPVFTVGSTLDELKKNMIAALNLYFEEKGKEITEADLKITLDLPQFFDFYKVINVSALAERIGINRSQLAQYISGARKPSAEKTRKILSGIRQIGRELSEINFL